MWPVVTGLQNTNSAQARDFDGSISHFVVSGLELITHISQVAYLQTICELTQSLA